jgi:hypothetical protein
MSREIATLQHELVRGSRQLPIRQNRRAGKTEGSGRAASKHAYLGYDPMKTTVCVAKPVLTRRELAKVLGCARYYVIEQPNHDPASRLRVDRHVELYTRRSVIGGESKCDAL